MSLIGLAGGRARARLRGDKPNAAGRLRTLDFQSRSARGSGERIDLGPSVRRNTDTRSRGLQNGRVGIENGAGAPDLRYPNIAGKPAPELRFATLLAWSWRRGADLAEWADNSPNLTKA
jgi:hypothetical protein